jgi:predicted dehydrogenase
MLRVDVRVAVFGLGAAGGGFLLPAVVASKSARVVLAVDPDRATHPRAGSVAVSTDAADAWVDDVDAVVIATPPDTHFALAMAAIAAGKAIYLEKPMASGVEDALALEQAADRAGVPLQVGFAFRFHPLWQRVIGARRAGSLKGPFTMTSTFHSPQLSSGGISPLRDVGCHHLDLACELVGGAPTAVESSAPARITVSWPDGSAMEGSYAVGRAIDHVQIESAERAIAIDRLSATRLRVTPRSLALSVPQPALVRARLFGHGFEPAYGRAIESFVRTVRDGRRPDPGPPAGVRALAIIEALEASQRSGAPVAIVFGAQTPGTQ